jgi:hypothetical protein
MAAIAPLSWSPARIPEASKMFSTSSSPYAMKESSQDRLQRQPHPLLPLRSPANPAAPTLLCHLWACSRPPGEPVFFLSWGRLCHERHQSLSAPAADALQLRALSLGLTKASLPCSRAPPSAALPRSACITVFLTLFVSGIYPISVWNWILHRICFKKMLASTLSQGHYSSTGWFYLFRPWDPWFKSQIRHKDNLFMPFLFR